MLMGSCFTPSRHSNFYVPIEKTDGKKASRRNVQQIERVATDDLGQNNHFRNLKQPKKHKRKRKTEK